MWQSSVERIANDFEKPGARIFAAKAGKGPERSQERLLHYIFCILLIAREPTCQVVGGIQVRQDVTFKISAADLQ